MHEYYDSKPSKTSTDLQTEALAADYVHRISDAKRQLEKGHTRECLALLKELEYAMQLSLAIDESYDLVVLN